MYEDLLSFAVDYARRLGAGYAEARFQRDVRESVVLKNGVSEVSARSVTQGVSVRVIVGNSMGFSSTNELRKQSIRRIVRDAVDMARAAVKVLSKGVSMGEGKLGRGKVEVKPRVPFDVVDVEAKTEYLKEADKAAVEACEKRGVKLPSRLIEVGRWDTEKHVVTSDGADVCHRIPRVTGEYFLTAYHPQRGSIQRFENLGEARGWEAVELWNLPQRLGEESEALAKMLLEAVEPPADEEVDVVVDSEIVGIVCHESAGHPGEADRVLGREAAQAGESYIKPDLLGTQIGSEHVTVVDDPSLPKSFGYYLYDDEGVEVRERKLIENGILKELLHNRETAAVFGVESNGAARASSYDVEPIIRMANTYMKPGDYSLQELIEGIRRGVYIRSYQEWNIDDIRWNQRYVGVESYLIEDGELRKPVRNPVIELTTRDFYSSIDAVGKELKFSAGYCGKGDPMQGIPVWFGGPPVRLRGIRLGRRPA